MENLTSFRLDETRNRTNRSWSIRLGAFKSCERVCAAF